MVSSGRDSSVGRRALYFQLYCFACLEEHNKNPRPQRNQQRVKIYCPSTMATQRPTASADNRSAPEKNTSMARMEEDGEKQGKLKRFDQQRMTSVFVFLAVLCLVFLAAIVKLKHSRYSPRSLRHKPASIVQNQHGELTSLPPNSIYRLEIQDGLGSPFTLDYSGMVSLVVNVASK
jgi:hypothetical protein